MKLDPELDAPHMTGPSRDYHQLYGKEDQYRVERHTIQPGRADYSVKTKPRPQTHERPNYDLVPGRTPVLVRNSNINPAAEGVGDATSEWNVSASLLGENDPGYTAPMTPINGKTIFAGVLLGFLAFRLVKN
jgi:hypothetical protein